MPDLAIYINTSPNDYRLAKGLIAGIEAYWEDPVIYMMPDSAYPHDRMFGYPIWRPEDPRVLALDNYYKTERVFWGPAERFIYFDADILPLQDITPFLTYVSEREGPFIAANNQTHHLETWEAASRSERRQFYEGWVGDLELIEQFDPDYDFTERMPFNSGLFAGTRDVIDQEAFLDTFEQAVAFHEALGVSRPFTMSGTNFFREQGFLNYFLTKSGVQIEWIDDLYVWGGDPRLFANLNGRASKFSGMFVHWAGCPRPGPLPLWPGIPKAAQWRRHYWRYCRERNDWPGFIRDACDYSVYCARRSLSNLKRRVLSTSLDFTA